MSDPWHLPNLIILNFEENNLTGPIPTKFFNISSLQKISSAKNSLFGNLPLDTGLLSCPNLETLYFGGNKLSGSIPSDLSNCSNLVDVDFSTNLLSGPIPKSLGNLKYLQILYLIDNKLIGEGGDQEPNFLSSLSNCLFLEELGISFNSLNITITDSIGNLSVSLRYFIAGYNQIKGQIPMGIGSFKKLTILHLSSNKLTGNIPSTLGELEGLERLHLRENNIGGYIPEVLCLLRKLGEIFISDNKISRSIPNCIGNLSRLQRLNIQLD